MNNWSDAVAEMDAALFDMFGDVVIIAGQTTTAIQDTSQEQFGVMVANVTRLSIPGSSGIKVRKGDKVVYKNRYYVVVDVPEYRDSLISFDLQ
ncbi:sugar transporter [Vibrio vulnificus]|nr:sugar transporter [Vibrio vulnificus]ELS0759365.1 sugar transporter [Vibrio vulnificus]MCU8373864.1 sugar transporter [Vibrio vulnificus]